MNALVTVCLLFVAAVCAQNDGVIVLEQANFDAPTQAAVNAVLASVFPRFSRDIERAREINFALTKTYGGLWCAVVGDTYDMFLIVKKYTIVSYKGKKVIVSNVSN